MDSVFCCCLCVARANQIWNANNNKNSREPTLTEEHAPGKTSVIGLVQHVHLNIRIASLLVLARRKRSLHQRNTRVVFCQVSLQSVTSTRLRRDRDKADNTSADATTKQKRPCLIRMTHTGESWVCQQLGRSQGQVWCNMSK